MIHIRPLDKAKDYPAYVTILNAINPDYPNTEEGCRHNDETHPSHLYMGRFVAEKAGVMVGVAGYWQREDYPQKFWVWIGIHPDYQHQGIGTTLYNILLETIAPYNPSELHVGTKENVVSCMQFVQKHGFVETCRYWESRLDVATFDPSVLQGAADKVMASGINIYSYAELAHDPERDRKAYDLDCRLWKDVPSEEVHVPLSFEEFKKRNIEEDPCFLPDAWFIAVEGDSKTGTYVGLASLTKLSGCDYLQTGLTGVLREYRGRGIASALKLRAALYAKERNIPEIRAGNAQENNKMLAINEKMGFVKQPAWVYFKKDI
jgi:GNAT superfamily N-acetyltransferase